ncbi:unnamed protein product [Caenorhabditis brenneri]
MSVVRLVKIDMHNFAGLQDTEGSKTVGMFAPFTVLYGFNGSGKTSTVRALAFVLGDTSGSKTIETGRVAMTVTKDRKEKVFERSKEGTEDKYSIDSVVVTEKVYMTELESTGFTLEMRKHMIFVNGSYAEIALRPEAEIAELLEEQVDSLDIKKQYKSLMRKVKAATKECDSEGSESKDAQKLESLEKELQEVKQQRRDEFNKLLDPLSTQLDKIYKSLYDSETVSMRLVPITEDEPYLGLKISCLPLHHGTVLIDIEELSTGEQKVASVAFLLAFNLVKKSPLVVFDEFDKAFYRDTSLKVGAALKDLASEMQIVVVCNDKFMRRSADSKIQIKLEDE